MPKDTFFNIKPAKQEAITKAFLEEFAHRSFEDASISKVVKSLGIAKGSIYQYFEDKLDLYLFLKSKCEKIKLGYVMNLQRQDYSSFWTYFRAMYEEGVKFYLDHPLESKFLNAIAKNSHSPTIKPMISEWKDQALTIFEQMIQAEVDAGHFRKDVSVKTMTFFLVSSSQNIGDYMESIYKLDYEKELNKEHPDFAQQEKVLLQSVDDYIQLLQKAFDQ